MRNKRGLSLFILMVTSALLLSSAVVANPFTDPALVAYWNFDEGSGTTLGDSTGNHDGTLQNMDDSDWVVTQKGTGLDFDGVDDYVDLGTMDAGGNAGLTISAWMYSDTATSNDVRIISKADGASNDNHWWMMSEDDDELRFRLKTGGTTTRLVASGNTFPTGVWINAIMVYDGSNMIIYKDGVEIARTAKTGTVDNDNTKPVTIGQNPLGSPNIFDGKIDEVAIWNRGLTPSEVTEVYNAGLAAPDATPPTTPTNVAALSKTHKQVSLSWSASSDPETGVASYKVYRDSVQVGTSSSTTYTDTNLNPETAYSYQISAVNGQNGESSLSTALPVTTDAAPPVPVVGNGDPILLFSDMVSAPKTGWDGSATQGAAVTIWGNNLDNVRGSSYVTVNGVDLRADTDYAVWGEFWPTPYQQRITFWLNDQMTDGAGQITVTVNGKTSNPLDFTIRPGRIFFVNPSNTGGTGTLANPFRASEVLGSSGLNNKGITGGDILYFRDGTYSQTIQHKSKIPIDGITPTANAPLSLVGYPGETPHVTSDGDRSAVRIFENHVTISNFRVTGDNSGAIGLESSYSRAVGNDVTGMGQGRSSSGTGIMNSGNQYNGDGAQNTFLGNNIHGGRGGWKQDHGIYLNGCASDGGMIVGWNYIHDMDVGRGALISVNHMDHPSGGPRCPPPMVMDSHFIFNNRVDCSLQRGRPIQIHQLSYSLGEQLPEPTYVYNNLFLHCGTRDDSDSNVGSAPAGTHSNGPAHFYNNVFYDTGYYGILIHARSTRLDTVIKNNIIHMNPSVNPSETGYIRYDSGLDYSNVYIEDNIVYGDGNPADCAQCASFDRNRNVDPLFVDAANGDFRLQATSPAIDVGQEITFQITPPTWANIGLDFAFQNRGASFDIGPYEYSGVASSLPAINRTPTIDTFLPNALARMNKSRTQAFSVTANDSDGDVLNYIWYVNGTVNGTGSSFNFEGAYFKKGYWNVTVVVTDGNTSTAHSWKYKLRTPKIQDLNDDDIVDIQDLRPMAVHVVKKRGFRAQYDLNNDGEINIFDLISIMNEWGTY